MLVKKIILLIGASAVLFALGATAMAEDDWEYRSSYNAAIPIREDMTLKINPELRYKENLNRYYRNQLNIGISGRLTEGFVLEANYKVINKNVSGDWQREIRPYLNATFDFELFGLKLSDRNRLERRIKEDEEFWRYRNKFSFSLPVFTSFKIKPRFAEEIFYDFKRGKFSKNRVYLGLEFKIVDKLKLHAEYIWENINNDENKWTKNNVVKTTIKYAF